MKPVRYLIRGNRFLFHLVFCAGVVAFLFLGMYLLYLAGFRFHNLTSALTDCFFFLLCIYTGRWLCSLYLRSRLAFFTAYTFVAVAGLAFIKWLLVRYIFNNPYAGFFELTRDVMPFFLIGVIMGILLKLISISMQKELEDARLKAEHKEMEFNLLQSQLSPHFLFNTLNNLYGISIEEHQRIPSLLLKLSHLLRYSVYGAKKMFVPLKEELEYIQTYIDFEQIRISDRLVFKTDIESIDSPDIKIAPSVLIVFIENAFKHAKNTLSQEILISLSLKIVGNFIQFAVTNSYDEEGGKDLMSASSGLGLANTLKRLELIYGDNYELKQYSENGNYHVTLNLRIKQDANDQLPYCG